METASLGVLKLQRVREQLLLTFAALVAAYGLVWFALSAARHTPDAHGEAVHAAAAVPAVVSVLPFVLLLGCIAVLPVIPATAHWWEHNWNRLAVSLGCALATLVYYALFYGSGVANHLTHSQSAAGPWAAFAVLINSWLVEYIPFLTLLFSLYTVSGGIVITGSMTGRPAVNLTMLGVGTLLASCVGTTGAAMLMIRPLLRANTERQHVAHTIVFFIFTVCNTGGCLLPIGDPPLFLGFMRGVAFEWTLSLWPMWLLMNGVLLLMYFLLDSWYWRQEKPAARERRVKYVPVRLRGCLNLLWLAGVVAAVATLDPSRPVPGTDWSAPLYYREIVLLSFTALSLWCTSHECRMANSFNYDAILEVAALFLGIFVCMQPAIQLLNAHGAQLGLNTPWKYFWATGLLSSVLDNAPTYVVFFETARTSTVMGPRVAGVPEAYLVAVSIGAVFLGAMTYIGNGPNLMVKAIAENQNVRMPSFFGYVVYSCAALLPASVLLTVVFLT